MTKKQQTISLDVTRIYKPDSHHLGSLFAGLSGSGKTTALVTSLQFAIKDRRFNEKHRFVIVDPKTQVGDYTVLANPITDVGKMQDSIRKERVSLFWPSMDDLEGEVSDIIDFLFQLSDQEPKASFTFVLDEAATLITGARIPPSLKRLSVQGRSKRIMPIFVSQRPLLSRWTDANLSNMFLFKILPVDSDNLNKRWGLNFEETNAVIMEKPYSFMWFDLENGSLKPMNPLPLPKPAPKKLKKGRWFKLFDL